MDLQTRALGAALALGVLLSACADIAGFDGNPQMKPGQDCLGCHSASGAASALTFSVAGTVYPSAYAGSEGGLGGAEIDITDANHRAFSIQSNGAGNFYSAEDIAFPATVSIKFQGHTFKMQDQAAMGSCNVCHKIEQALDGTIAAAALPPAAAADAGLQGSITPGHLFATARSCTNPPPPFCPSPAPSYQKQVQTIIQANCLRCHTLEQQAANIAVLDNVPDIQATDQAGLNRVASCNMPPVGTWFEMSPEERDILMGWMACGSPEN